MRTVAVVGVGALGSHAVMLLRNLDVRLRIIDFDRIEQKNVMSQFHAKPSVGKPKVMGLQQSMKFLFGTRLEAIGHKLVADNVRELLAHADLVIDCLDNAEARHIVVRHVRDAALPCLHGALAADASFGRVVWDEDFVIDAESSEGAATCENGEHLPFIALTAAYLAKAAQEFLAHDRKIGFSVHAGGADRIERERQTLSHIF